MPGNKVDGLFDFVGLCIELKRKVFKTLRCYNTIYNIKRICFNLLCKSKRSEDKQQAAKSKLFSFAIFPNT